MSEARIFRLPEGYTAAEVGRDIEKFLTVDKKLEAEGMETNDGYFIQARNTSTIKTLIGLDMAAHIMLTLTDDKLKVDVGSGKWLDKLGIGAIGVIAFAPLAVTSMLGAALQATLPDEIFQRISVFLIKKRTDTRKDKEKE